MFEYKLESTEGFRCFYFTRFNKAIVAIGDKEPSDSTDTEWHHWKLDNRGCLLISEDENEDPYFTFGLVEIVGDRAKLLDVDTGVVEEYVRRFTD